MPQSDTIEDTKIKFKKPKKWAVIIHNDDVTPMDFVVELLYHVFRMDLDQATKIMIKIHTEGKGIAGIYHYEIAEQKYNEALVLIKISNMQLKITLEEE